MEIVSANGLSFTCKIGGENLTMTNPTGQSYTARLDGAEAPSHVDPGTTRVSVKRMSNNTLEENDKRDGKLISVFRMTPAPDRKTVTITVSDKLHGTTCQFVATKQ